MTAPPDAGRRRFLRIFATATGALVVGLPAFGWTPDELLGQNLIRLNPYLRIEPDGTTVIGARDPEVGQGIRTAEARLIAEELDADWSRVIVSPLALGVSSVNGEPHWTLGHQMASGSTSIPAAWSDLRSVGAAARNLLLRAAAQRLQVDAAKLQTARGVITAPNGRKLGYGELATAASQLKPDSAPPALKNPTQYTLIGHDAGDVDARDIVTGRQAFAIDTWFGDVLVGVITHCPYPGGKLKHLDDTAALKVTGVRKVMAIPPPSPARALGTQQLAAGVAVLADDTWSALEGMRKLQVEWQPGTHTLVGDDALAATAAAAFGAEPTQSVRVDGDFAAIAKRMSHRFKAEYRFSTIAHAELEPPNALVKVDSQRAVIIAPVQNPRATFETVRRLTGLSPDNIDLQLPRAGGGFGRFLETDYVAEAVMLAKAAGKPVKLMWTRTEAFAHDTYRPFSVQRLEASLDRKRKLTGWSHLIASTSRLAGREVPARWWLSEMHPDDLPAGLVDNLTYGWYSLGSALPRGTYRASSHAVNAFATECFTDEIAHGLRMDPLKFRLDLLGPVQKLPYRGRGGPTLDTGRLAAVLQLAADAVGWSKKRTVGHGFGIACHFTFGGYVAHAMDVSVQGKRLIVNQIACAADLGRVVNPLGARAALVGATLDAFSTALGERITVKDGRIVQTGYRNYPLAAMAAMPNDVQVILAASEENPTGAFAMGFPSAGPALANALFDATGKRVRELPLWPAYLKLA